MAGFDALPLAESAGHMTIEKESFMSQFDKSNTDNITNVMSCKQLLKPAGK